MHIQGKNSTVDRSTANPTVTSTPSSAPGALARITVGVRNFVDGLFSPNTVPVPAQPVQASSPRWQTKPTPPALAPEHLRPALIQDNWEALQRARSDHPGLANDDNSLMWHAVQAGAFRIALELQRRGVDAFGPDAERSAFYAAFRSGNDHFAAQMLALKVEETPKEFPDLAPYLEDALDKKDGAAIDWLIDWSSRNNVQLPCDVMQDAIKNNNRGRLELLIGDAIIARGIKPLPGTVFKPVGAPWLSTVSENSGQTALHLAVASGDSGLVSTLLDYGADVNKPNSINQTPLAFALDKGLFDLAIQLLERGAQPIISNSSSAEGEFCNQGHATVKAELSELQMKECGEFTDIADQYHGNMWLNVESHAHFQSFLQWMQTTSSALTSLNFSNLSLSGKIGVEGARALAEILKENTTVEKIDLTGNNIGSNGACALAEMLETNTTIKIVELAHNNIGARGARALAKMLETNTTFEEINIFDNNIGDDGARAIAKMLETNTFIKKINIGYNGIRKDGAVALAKTLATHKTVTGINLGANNVGVDGARALFNMLKTNSAMADIGLYQNAIGPDGARALAEILKTNTSVTSINLFQNEIGDDGAWALTEMLKNNTTITTIDLSENAISTKGGRELAEMLKTNTTLTRLVVLFNKLDDVVEAEIKDALKRNAMLPLMEKAAISANEMLNHQTLRAAQPGLPILPLDVTRLITEEIVSILPMDHAKRILWAMDLRL